MDGAYIVNTGYPVNVEWLHNFSDNVPLVLMDCARDIVRQLPDNPPFQWNPKRQAFSMFQKNIKDWIKANHSEWEYTETGEESLALESFERFYDFRHDYPEGNMGAQMVRYLKLKQSMNGYNPNADKTIFDHLGSDGRIRPYLNAYGAQSSRFQPGSTGFMFLKPAFQRAMVQPRPGRAIGDLDYSSQEFLISALLSGDRNMLEAYRSGDVYLAFGKMIGWIPKDGTKKSHQFERNVCKSLVLGLSYLMTKYGLSRKLTVDTGKLFSEEEAQELVEQFDETFDVFAEWRKELIQSYRDDDYLRLGDGWYMWGDNKNDRSVGNCPVQGAGAAIMRKAIRKARDAGLCVLFPLHDALYIEYDEGDLGAIDRLKECMVDAFVEYFPSEMRPFAETIRVDPNTWSPRYPKVRPSKTSRGWEMEVPTVTTPVGMVVPYSDIFIDPRSLGEYMRYCGYMQESSGEELLG